jgi:hypothetical protein
MQGDNNTKKALDEDLGLPWSQGIHLSSNRPMKKESCKGIPMVETSPKPLPNHRITRNMDKQRVGTPMVVSTHTNAPVSTHVHPSTHVTPSSYQKQVMEKCPISLDDEGEDNKTLADIFKIPKKQRSKGSNPLEKELPKPSDNVSIGHNDPIPPSYESPSKVKRKNKKIKRLKQEALEMIVLNRCIQKENELLKEQIQNLQEEIRKLWYENRKMQKNIMSSNHPEQRRCSERITRARGGLNILINAAELS